MARTRHRDRAEAFNLGAAGENAPDWVMGDPSLLAAFDQGQADGEQGPAFHPPAVRKSGPAANGGQPAPAKKPATTRPGSTKTSKSGSDGSGLLLAVLTYPMLLALVKSGPSGVSAWIKAKFFNKVAGSSTPAPAVPKIGGTQIPVTPTPQPGGKTGPYEPTPAR